MSEDNCTHDCANCFEECDSEEYMNETEPDTLHKSSSIKHVIAIASAKGGIGKSVSTSILASELSKSGFRTGILDAGLYNASISIMFGINDPPKIIKGGMFPVQTSNGVSVISFPLLTPDVCAPLFWDETKTMNFAKQFWTDVIWGNLDFLLIDTPSDTADIVQWLFGLSKLDGIIALTDPNELADVMASRTINYAFMRNIPILGLIENFNKTGIVSDSTKSLSEHFEIPVSDTLTYDPVLNQKANCGEIFEISSDNLPGIKQMLIDMYQNTQR